VVRDRRPAAGPSPAAAAPPVRPAASGPTVPCPSGVPVLRAEGLARSFGGVYALDDVSVSVGQGELRGVIGPNGAGKSTLFHLIAGHLSPDQGTIAYRGRRIDRLAPHERAGLRISIVFQAARLFSGMTVLENVMVGAHVWTRHGFAEAALRLPRHRREEREIRRRAEEAVQRVGLGAGAAASAESLPLGQQRSLQVARALCGEPDLLLLDEPASGLRAAEKQALAALLRQLKDGGLTMMLIEHDVGFVSALADVVTVLDLGKVIAEGAPEAVRRDPAVIAAYIGRESRETGDAAGQ
jgi:branched-chain amino acid transport system ATP-binding protein